MIAIVRYKKHQDAYTTYQLATPDRQEADAPQVTELATLEDGYTYVAVPDGVTLPEQPTQITVEPVTLTPLLREQIKAASPHCELIAKQMQDRIRSNYSLEDEMYFARIGVGAANGLYQPDSSEFQAMTVFGEFVEAVRQWGRAERAKLGL
jgi:hypothetical protein